MRALGFDVKKADVLKVLKDYDHDGSGKIQFDDFKEVGKWQSLTEKSTLPWREPKAETHCPTNLL